METVVDRGITAPEASNEPRRTLQAFARALGREMHSLRATDLEVIPAFVFQQLYNRLQWTLPEQAAQRAAEEASRRSAPDRPPWIHLLTPFRESAALLRTMNAGAGSLAFLPDGRHLVCGGPGVQLWDVAIGRFERGFLEDLIGEVKVVGLLPDGRRVLVLWNRSMFSLDLARGGPSVQEFLEHCTVVSPSETLATTCSLSSDGGLLGIGWGRDVRVAELASRRLGPPMRGHQGGVNQCRFTGDGQGLVSASDDGTLRIWDVRAGTCLAVLEGHGKPVNACAVSPDGRTVISASDDGTLRLWDAVSGRCRAVLEGHRDEVRWCAVSPDGELVASAASDHDVRLWSLTSGTCRALLPGHGGTVRVCSFSPDGRLLASGADDHTVKLWDVEEALRTGDVAGPVGHTEAVTACDFSHDGERVVTSSCDHTARVWDSTARHCEGVLAGHGDRVNGCAFSPDGELVVTAGEDGSVRLWSARDWRCARAIDVHDAYATACDVSPDGRSILSAGRHGTLRLWKARNGKLARTIEVHGGVNNWVDSCAYSPSGRCLISGSDDGCVRLWESASGRCRSVFTGGSTEGVHMSCAVRECRFSPDGTLVIAACDDNCVRLWRVDGQGGSPAVVLHVPLVNDAQLFSEGAWLAAASGAGKGVLSLWDAESRGQVALLPSPGALRCIAVHPVLNRLAFGDAGGWVGVADVHVPVSEGDAPASERWLRPSGGPPRRGTAFIPETRSLPSRQSIASWRDPQPRRCQGRQPRLARGTPPCQHCVLAGERMR